MEERIDQANVEGKDQELCEKRVLNNIINGKGPNNSFKKKLKQETRRRLKSWLAKSGRNAITPAYCERQFCNCTRPKNEEDKKSVPEPFLFPPKAKDAFVKGVLWFFFVFRSQLFPRYPYAYPSNPQKAYPQ